MRPLMPQAKLPKVDIAGRGEAAELNLSYTRITAPVDAWPTHKQVEAGTDRASGQGLGSCAAAERLVARQISKRPQLII